MTKGAALDAPTTVAALREVGLGPLIGIPCSFLAPLIAWCEKHSDGLYLAANNEGEAVAVAAGAYLAGRRPVVIIQNSGLGNAVNPLTSLCHTMRIPVLMLITWRGEPGRRDEPQHRLMGRIMGSLLDLMEIGHEPIAGNGPLLSAQLRRLSAGMAGDGLPRALIVPSGAIAAGAYSAEAVSALPPRRAVIRSLLAVLPEDVLLVATTGKTGRELACERDRPTNLYVVGSMGCASSIGLGLALERRDRAVVILDGDGAALMRLEAMVSIGARAPGRLVHVLLDNGAYESTGGQATLSTAVDLVAVARACGYRQADEVDATAAAEHVASALGGDGPHFLRVPISAGSHPGLGRPRRTPEDVAATLRHVLTGRS